VSCPINNVAFVAIKMGRRQREAQAVERASLARPW
jgi:hypothetical protein